MSRLNLYKRGCINMSKDKPLKPIRDDSGRFVNGHKHLKRKCPITKEQMNEAISTVEANINISKGKKLLTQAIEWCYTDKDMMKFILERYVEKANVATTDIKPLQIIIERYYQAKDKDITEKPVINLIDENTDN